MRPALPCLAALTVAWTAALGTLMVVCRLLLAPPWDVAAWAATLAATLVLDQLLAQD
jgi:hypothetical protein